MRKCDDCKIILEDGVRFCPKCGQAVDARAASPAPAGDTTSLLAAANLKRIRGQLDEAAADASNAMKQDPNDPGAAALLASIFEERGDMAEAAVWYKIASDLDPGNAVHKAQLDWVGKAVASGRGQGGARKLPSAPVLWAIGVGLSALLLASILIFARGGPARPRTQPAARQNRELVRIVTPESAEARRSGSYPEQTGTQGTRTQPPKTQGAARTAGEAALKASASQADAVTKAGARVNDVIADPRQRVATVTFSLPVAGVLTRGKVLTVAEGMARAVFAANGDIQYVTARCVVPSSGAGGTQIGFVGDTARQTILALPDNPTAEQLGAAFANQWWNDWIK